MTSRRCSPRCRRGPVGVGDRIGEADVELIRRTCRADGVLVRPDVPIAAVDAAMFDAPVWTDALLSGSAYTQHSAGRWGYVARVQRRNDKQPRDARVAFAGVGEDRPATDRVAVFDWRSGRVDVMPADGAYDVALEPAGWDYRVLAPVLPGGIAVIGDPALYACAGDARIADVAADGDGVDRHGARRRRTRPRRRLVGTADLGASLGTRDRDACSRRRRSTQRQGSGSSRSTWGRPAG